MRNVKKGEIRLVTKNGDADFYGGIFQLKQQPAKNAVTELVLKGGNFAACKPGTHLFIANSPLKKRKQVRSLWGNGKGHFRTRARYSSATVRGTIWLTADRCDGSLTSVRKGVVEVFDFVLKKTIVLKPGQSYLAKPR